MQSKVDVIDLFAGPGGLGEGFSNCKANSPFEIRMSVENEKHAHKTLTLRSFYRKLKGTEKKAYFNYVASSTEEEKNLNFSKMTQKHSEKWEAALRETMYEPHALGNPRKWEKIKKGIPLGKEDYEDTKHEKAIFKRIREIKEQSKKPLIVIGGPPCQAYSVNGRNRIKVEDGYTPENDERFFLYQEYLKVLDAANPDLFIMENVEGITSAKLASGERIFERIKRELRRPENSPDEQYDLYSLVTSPTDSSENGPQYLNDNDYTIKASDFGVPQHRKRIILLGILRKHGRIDSIMHPKAKHSAPTLLELIGTLPKIRSGISKRAKDDGPNTYERWLQNWVNNKAKLKEILTNPKEIGYVVRRQIKNDLANHKKQNRPALSSIEENLLYTNHRKLIKKSFAATYTELKKLGQRSFLQRSNEDTGNDFCLHGPDTPSFSKSFSKKYVELHRWLISNHSGVLNHGARDHMNADFLRYFFCSLWAKAHRGEKSPSPNSKYFPRALTPAHENWESGNHADRFRAIEGSQIPLTITSHLRKDGHAQIHYDPVQNRSLTVREAARIQTFPDDYYFEGKRGWQFQQVGNAVPSFLAKQIALHVLQIMKKKKIIA
jgi:DNA (cytosine-5)-methyltransferase 1